MKVKYFSKALTVIIISFTIILLSCEKDKDNNQNPLELKITDINLSNCIDSIDNPRLHLKMIDDNKLKITHYGAEFCCSDTGKADVELTKINDEINLKEIDLGPYTYCFCKHNLEFTISGIDYGKQKFKIIESEHAYQRDTCEFYIDLSPSIDTLIHIEKGKVLFCTNSYIINCPFSIEISVENKIIDTLNAASEYNTNNCSCPDTFGIGLSFEMTPGNYNYSAREINCSTTNKTDNWNGEFTIKPDSCETVFLDINE